MPKRVEPAPPEPKVHTPHQDILAQVYAHSEHLKNLVICAHYDDGSSQVLYSVQQELDVWSFVDAMKLQAAQRTLEFLAPPPEPPTKQIS